MHAPRAVIAHLKHGGPTQRLLNVEVPFFRIRLLIVADDGGEISCRHSKRADVREWQTCETGHLKVIDRRVVAEARKVRRHVLGKVATIQIGKENAEAGAKHRFTGGEGSVGNADARREVE